MSKSTKGAAAAVPSTITVPKSSGHAFPIDIHDARDAYPRLYREFALMAEREREGLASITGGEHAGKTPADGRVTEISGVDFAETLEPLEGEGDGRTELPFQNDHVVNLFSVFAHKMLLATDSGTVGGNACRQNRVMVAALGDIRDLRDQTEQIHLLFGLMMAMRDHGLHETLSCGDPHLLRSIFGEMAREFKRFNEERYADEYDVGDDLRRLINEHCRGFQTMLRSTRKTIGEHAETYTFNYIRIPRAARSKENSANGEKRRSADGGGPGGLKSAKRPKPPTEAELLMDRVNAVGGVPADPVVYDSCDELRGKILAFLARDGVTKRNLCAALGNINNNSLGRLLRGQGQDQKGNCAYVNSYVFFEKMRLMEGQPKSAARLRNEERLGPAGFDATKSKGGRPPCYYYCPKIASLMQKWRVE